VSNEIVLAVLGITTLFGASLLWVRRADRQREGRRQRLRAFAPAVPSAVGAGPTLVRSAARRGARDGSLLARLLAWLEGALAATGGRIGVVHLAAVAAAAAVLVIGLATLLLALRGVFVIAAAVAAGLAAALLLVYFAQGRYRTRFLNAFPDALDLLGRAVRAGLPVVDAMAVAGREIPDPVGPVFVRVLDETRIGVDIDEVLQRTADRIRVPDFRFFVVAIALQRRTGGALAETLGNLSRIIRRRKEVRLKARALSAEANASATVLGLLPFFVGGVMYLLNRPLMSILLTDPRGRLMLGLALLNLAMGISTMVFIIKRTMR
jgi:tight adherence protein B